MVGLAENIQACLRIFRRAQHQWLVRDILHLPQGVFTVFVLWHTGQLLHIALCCLEGSTLSNLVHRRRRCARIVLQSILCLEGSTPEDGGGASHQSKVIVVAPWEPILYCQRQLFCFLGA